MRLRFTAQFMAGATGMAIVHGGMKIDARMTRTADPAMVVGGTGVMATADGVLGLGRLIAGLQR
jgi:hypothetical protein